MKAAFEEVFAEDFCVLSLSPLLAEQSLKEEHVILQGLGPRWLKLPPGFVLDQVNNSLSEPEGHLLRGGLLGSLRWFYLNRNGRHVFRDNGGRSVVMHSFADKATQIYVEDEGDLLSLREENDGFSLRIPVDEPSSSDASRALHKMALLVFSVVNPRAALDPYMLPTRSWIVEGTESLYRPFHQAPAEPMGLGFSAAFQIDTVRVEKTDRLVLESVCATIRLNHVVYSMALAGSMYSDDWANSDGEFLAHPLPTRKTYHEVGWHGLLVADGESIPDDEL